MNKGKLFVFTGPSGTGKGTILKEVLASDDRLRLSVSATTRGPREGEVNGVHYWFLKKEDFEAKIAQDAFLEHACYVGNYYGTPEQPVNDQKQLLRPDGFDQIIQCPHAIALIGKAGGRGEKDDLGDIIKAADLPRRLHAAGPGHHHIQQIQGKPLFSGGVQQLGGISEGLIPQSGFVLFLPDMQ